MSLLSLNPLNDIKTRFCLNFQEILQDCATLSEYRILITYRERIVNLKQRGWPNQPKRCSRIRAGNAGNITWYLCVPLGIAVAVAIPH